MASGLCVDEHRSSQNSYFRMKTKALSWHFHAAGVGMGTLMLKANRQEAELVLAAAGRTFPAVLGLSLSTACTGWVCAQSVLE